MPSVGAAAASPGLYAMFIGVGVVVAVGWPAIMAVVIRRFDMTQDPAKKGLVDALRAVGRAGIRHGFLLVATVAAAAGFGLSTSVTITAFVIVNIVHLLPMIPTLRRVDEESDALEAAGQGVKGW